MERVNDYIPAVVYTPGFLTSVYDGYVDLVTKVVQTIFCGWWGGNVLLEILCEPITFVKSAYHFILGRVEVEKFHTNDLNPTDLKALKTHNVAIILIHGASLNHGSWIPLAKKIKEAGVGPAFTVDLNDGSWPWNYDNSPRAGIEDVDRVNRRVEEIEGQYTSAGLEVPMFLVVGHSRGAIFAQNLAKRDDVVATVTVGGPCEEETEKVFDILGSHDRLMPPALSKQPKGSKLEFKRTHLGLLYDDAVHKFIVELAKESETAISEQKQREEQERKRKEFSTPTTSDATPKEENTPGTVEHYARLIRSASARTLQLVSEVLSNTL